MTLRLPDWDALPAVCPVCRSCILVDPESVGYHQRCVDGYNQCAADVVAYLHAVVGHGHLSSAIERGDAFGAAKR